MTIMTIKYTNMDRKTTRQNTKFRRQQKSCKAYEIKVDKSKLSKKSLHHLNQLFIEAKWFYNYCLSHDNIIDSNTKAKSVHVKVQGEFEERKFSVLKAAMKQQLKKRLFNSMSSLKSKKSQGYKIGRLKFKSKLNSIPLNNQNFHIDLNSSRIRIVGMKSWIKVRGLNQIADNSEIANATLIKKADDFFINVTTYEDKEKKDVPDQSIGIDFGCETQLSFSDGTKVEFQVPTSKRIKKLDRKISRRGKSSNSKNKQKDKRKREKAYRKLNNKKKDIRNKVVSAVKNNFSHVCFQDENIHAWHSGNHGKKIQHSGIGGIIFDLKHKPETPLQVNRFFPSTQLCPSCGRKNKHSLSERIYQCECGYSKDRDIHAAVNIELEGLKHIPVGHRELTLTENTTAAFFDTLNQIDGVKVSKSVH